MQQDQRKKSSPEREFFSGYTDSNRYQIQEVVGKGSYGVVCSATDSQNGEKVAIKKIKDIFEHTSDAAKILREIKLLRMLRHPDIVEIKHIMLPPSKKDFKDIYVVFELMDTDLHQVIKANDDLTKEHHQFFLYQMLRALKYIHTANVYHRDLKPKNILANANCKLKICDFGLARVAFNDTPTTVFWTDYVATRWYRAPELCGSFFSKYSPAIDIWSIGCIFAEILTGKPLFPGKHVVHQLDLITDLLGSPSTDTISKVRNEKTRRYLSSMRRKHPVPFSQKFPKGDPLALSLLERLLAFDPKDRPTAEEALADPYFKGLSRVEREPSCRPISKMEFEFERKKVTKDDLRELIFREILEYHPQVLKDYTSGTDRTSFLYPSAVDQFRRQFANLEENDGESMPVASSDRKHASLPRSSTVQSASIAPKSEPHAERVPPGTNKTRIEKMNRKLGDWNCRSCQYLNFSRRDMCQRCGETRTGGDFGANFGGGRGMSSFGGGFGGSDVRPGDWYCNCGAHNFGSRSSCFKCGVFKEESAIEGGFDGDMPRSRGFGFGNVGGGGRPGWKSDDWICTRSGCNEHNFASRMECFRCNAPRESGTYYAPRESGAYYAPRESGAYYAPRKSGELRQNQIQIYWRTSRETTTTESNPNISMNLSEKDSFNESLTVSVGKSSIFSDTSEETIEQKYLTTEIQTRSTEKLEANRSEKTEILSHENINLNSNSNLTENSSKEEHVESITNKEEPNTEPFGGSFHEIPLIGQQSISSLKRIEIEDCDLLHALPDGSIPYGPCNARCGAHDLSILPYSTGHTMHEANTFGRDADFLSSEKEKSTSVVSINDEGGLTDHMVDKATIFGRSAETMEVSNFLLSEREKSFSVISIVGKGGVGKTTIAQLVYKDLRASRSFDLFGWVCVSEGFDVRRLIKVTIESISKINYGVSELSLLQVELAEIVKEKTILLVLDDVCNENQSLWELFQEPFIEAKMVRILVTTRNEKVAEVMQTTICYRPTNLPEYSCWQLFQHHALSSTSETLPTHLVDMGREIMRKCDGLPLAVKIIASLLRHETDVKVWREILESDLWESNPTNNIFPALQISYDHLPAHLKLCFLVCSMYPKDYLLEKMNLIDIWISHGYIESRDKRRITKIGVEYYKELKERSFIDGFSNCIPEWWHMQPMYALDESSGQFFEFCKLHDIIHDLARYNSKKEHYSMEINQPLDIQKENFPPEVHHLYAGGFVGYVKQILQRNDKNLKDLRTLSLDVRGCSGDLEHQYCINNTEAVDLNSELSKDYEECSREVAISNLIKFEGLTVLELKGYNLRKIPDCISKLKHLAYLSITSSYLKVLPLSIGLLYNLQTLFLNCFLLEYLPENIGNLANLQFLYIKSGRVKKLPKSLCSLNNLLRLVIISDDLEEVPLDIKNLCNLHTLTIRSNQIQALPNTIGCLTNLEELNLLSLGGSYDDLPVGKLDYVPHGFVNFLAIKTMAAWMGVRTINWLKDMKDLEGKLSIGGLKHMSNLENAQHANLRNKCKLETLDLCWDPGYYISPYDVKSELRLSLIPEACKGELVCADDVVSFSLLECLQPHPNLKKLLIRWYPSPTVPYWMTDPSSFRSIQEVLLECCVNIQSLPFKNFHTLKHLTIVACSSIRVLQLEQVSYQLEKLQIVSCDNLELITGLGDLNMLAALEIYSCQALKSLTMGGKQLVLSTETFEDSSHEKPHTSKQSIVSLGRLEIENCYLLHFLPDGLIPPGPCYVCVRGCGCPDMERNLISAAKKISCTSNLWRWR